MLTPEKFLKNTSYHNNPNVIWLMEKYGKALLQSIIDDLEANRNKNAVEYLKSKL